MELSDHSLEKKPVRPRQLSRRYLVSGRVQGVGFRYFTQKTARLLGLAGWVRNLADGRVEAHAQGSAQQLEDLEGRLHVGPPGAQVRAVEVTDSAADAKIEGFHIR